ncbi:MAG TPA: dihydroorotate dehydrogenase [Candidatus Coproplasma avistercoris]|nr:dihydroorotate dehydrogenase [Candidatus Coproplasma avistercoris]
MKLSVEICGVKFNNPVIAASGTFGFGREYDELYDISAAGGVSTKGLTPERREGNPVPRIAEGKSVILNAVGLQNPGVEEFIKNDLGWLSGKTRVIANVAGRTLEDYEGMCTRLDGLVDMIELNISCPNVRAGGMALGIKPENVEEVTRLCRGALRKTPLIVKLSPNVESIAANAQAAQRGGADCISLINTLTGMVIDIERRRPVLANNTGGVSGAGIMPIALRMVFEAAHAVSIPVIGMGGITCGRDAIAFMMAGARAVQVGTANFTDSYAIPRIVRETEEWLEAHGISDVNEIVDTLQLN